MRCEENLRGRSEYSITNTDMDHSPYPGVPSGPIHVHHVLPYSTLARISSGMSMVSVLLFTHLSTPPQSATLEQQLVVPVTGGNIQGYLDGSIRTWKGVPFAAPPLAHLRWTPPQPVIAWSGVRNATTFGSQCTQGGGAGSEDCLFLNVFAPLANQSSSLSPTTTTPSKQLLPVMLWVHGGGYQSGNGEMDFAAMLDSLDGKAIGVATNYRYEGACVCNLGLTLTLTPSPNP
jgi:hypothetical protein